MDIRGQNGTVKLRPPNKEDYFYNEAIKALRTNIQFCGNNIHVIMITSSIPGEGKTMTSFALARSFSQIGRKTLFIDADIRKSVMLTRYQVDRDVYGLSQYLSGQIKLEEVIYSTNIEDMDIIFSGRFAPNPAELLEEELFIQLIDRASKEYDYIIIDTPPMANVIDSAVIAKSCDGAVIVIESGKISYKTAQKVKLQLEKSGCRILGAVLNKTAVQERGYYAKYYGGRNKYKYSKDTEQAGRSKWIQRDKAER
ncbi:CpsD/CapB family tyrosine-protein kinase [Johnsonella ignava]|uniref:CpsD/CapB family tyrosine-protein kinase n=1 Tax=Johnsonella ignava TaxID=43995 RepID=UPI0023F4DAAA|nr:CpsD/CapB family tyrosine-protein kinase [Johnsonella ignava]